jgi:cytochrome c oxidase subunit 2
MRHLVFLLVGLTVLVGCNSAPSGYSSLPATGDAAAGQALFQNGAKDAIACNVCHSVDGSPLVGPSMKGIATTAASRVSGQSAGDYLYRAIVDPKAYIVPNYDGELMPKIYGKLLTPQQQRDLVEYLLTLK